MSQLQGYHFPLKTNSFRGKFAKNKIRYLACEGDWNDFADCGNEGKTSWEQGAEDGVECEAVPDFFWQFYNAHWTNSA